MPRFAANLSTLFTDVPLIQRFARAARAGFSAVELQFPYALPAQELRAALRAQGQQMVLHNVAPGSAGDWAAGVRGLACLPGREADFRASIGQAIGYATLLGVPQLHCMCGFAPADADAAEVRRTLINNLLFAARAFNQAGLRLLIEPLNRFDMPGYWLGSVAQAVSVLDELQALGVRNAFIQYDLYHAQRSQGELAATLQALLPRIGHVQVADNPGRHEPGTGEINFGFLFQELDRLGYSGWVGCEYNPAAGTEAGLGWMRTLAGPAINATTGATASATTSPTTSPTTRTAAA